jgi:NAD-dependent deacetylase
VVWFGESLHHGSLERATRAVEQAQVVLVIGTSAMVYPVAALPGVARAHHARVVEINVESTPLTAAVDAVLRGPAAEMLVALERAL